MWLMVPYFSDMLFPVWWIGLIVFLRHKKCPMWAAWFLSTSFILMQAFVVGKMIGFNFGMYLVIFLSQIPSTVSERVFHHYNTALSSNVFLGWVFAITEILVLPTAGLYAVSRWKKKGQKTPNQAL